MKTFLALTGLSLSLTCGSHAAGLEISPFAPSADPLVHICTFNQVGIETFTMGTRLRLLAAGCR